MKLLKFYNPFKAHIVQFANGKFAVRKWNVIAWEYKERAEFNNDSDEYWWNLLEYANKYCTVGTLQEAIHLREYVKSNPLKAVKVYG